MKRRTPNEERALIITLDTTRLHQAASGAVWGNINLSHGDLAFPGAVWNDLVVAVMEQWGQSLLELTNKAAATVTFRFFDGDFSVIASRSKDVLHLKFWGASRSCPAGTGLDAQLRDLVSSYVMVARKLNSAVIALGDSATSTEGVALSNIAGYAAQLSNARIS